MTMARLGRWEEALTWYDRALAIRPDFAILSGLRVGVVGASKSTSGDQDAHFEVRAFTAAGY